jgi:transposase-like protein
MLAPRRGLVSRWPQARNITISGAMRAENLYGAEDTEVLRPGERFGFATVGCLRYPRASRQQYSAKEKVRIVIAGLRGEHSVAELCRKEGTNQDLYYRSSRGLLEAGNKRLASDTARETCSGGGPAQHARVDPTRNKLTVVQIAEKLPFVDDHLTAQNGRDRPAFDFPSLPWTVVAYVEVFAPERLVD